MIKNECGHAYKLLDHAECLWCEDCVKKLVARLKKPEITEEWIEGKARELNKLILEMSPVTEYILIDSRLNKYGNFIRTLAEEIIND